MSSESIKVEGDFPVHFRYTAGLAGEKFLREIKDNARLVASRCLKCGLNYLPPRISCERCMSRLEEYVPIESVGVVAAVTRCRYDPEGKELAEPVPLALVRFPSAHGGLIHRVKGTVQVGDKVRVIFKEKLSRIGSILDIEHFEKVR
ncbi:MAG TPA: Zn-ribbon domain-containing OB-fold protein [Terriglobales bacterium]|nr:Zn-ribbon domain-containing OB-fold protein [Terriglobales bacterium]